MKFSTLKDRAVIDLATAHKLGELDNLIIDPTSHQVVGLKVKSGLFSSADIIPMVQVQSVGRDAITVNLATGDAATTGDKLTQKAPELKSLLGQQVLTDSGKLVGEINDVLLDDNSLAITGYEFSGSGLFAKKQTVTVEQISSYGANLIIIPEHLATQPDPAKP